MLVAYIAEIVLRKHERQIAHLYYPQTIRVHHTLDVIDKLSRFLQVVKHRDRSHNPRTNTVKVWIGEETAGLKKTHKYFIGHSARELVEILSGIKTNLVDSGSFVGSQQSAVVAANV